MAYEVDGSGVRWKSKLIKGLASDGFRQLADDRFAVTDGRVLMSGKPLDVDADTFQLLSASFAKDANTVFEIMEKKLKPVEGADAPTFHSVGSMHGADASMAWWRAKRIKKANAGGLRELNPHYSTDGQALFYVNKQLKFTSALPVDLKKCTLIAPGSTNAINISEFILHDDRNAIVVYPRYAWTGLRYVLLETDKFSHVSFLDEYLAEWVSDGDKLFYSGSFVSLLGDAQPVPLTRSVARLGQSVFVGDQNASDRVDANSLVHIDTDIFADRTGVWSLSVERSNSTGSYTSKITLNAERTQIAGVSADHIEAFARAAFDFVFRLREHLPYEGHWRDQFWDKENYCEAEPPESCYDVGALRVEQVDNSFQFQLDGQSVVGPVHDWYGLAQRLWSRLEGAEGAFVPFPHSHHMDGRGLHAQTQIFRRVADEALRATAALWNAGFEDDARLLCLQIGFEVGYGGSSDLSDFASLDALASVPPDVLRYRVFERIYSDIVASTYLAGSKRLLASGCFKHEDPRVRFEAMVIARLLTGGTGKDTAFLKALIPVVRERIAVEPFGFIRDHALSVVDIACRPSVFDKDWHDYARPHLEFLIGECVNVEINKARLEQRSDI
ncbi:MAG: DKNYY domain-containing protein [Pseudomonadota bacterium]